MKIRARLSILTFAFCMLLVSLSRASLFYQSAFGELEGQRPRGFRLIDTQDSAFWMVRDGWLDTGDGHHIISPDGFSYAAIDTPGADQWSDYIVSCRFFMAQPSGGIVLAGRWLDRSNHYAATVEVFQGRRMFHLTKKTRGRTETLASTPIDLAELGVPTIENGSPQTALTLSLAFVGSQITATLGGRVQLTAQDYDRLTGTVAIGGRYTRGSFGDIVVASGESIEAMLADARPADLSAPQGQTYTVQLNRFRSIADARSLASSLRLLGYFPSVQATPDGFHAVYLGRFATLEEANKMLAHMVEEQFLFARVITVAEDAAPTEPSPLPARPERVELTGDLERAVLERIPEDLRRDISWQRITPSEQRRVIDAIRRLEAMDTRTQSVAEIMELKQQIDAMNERQAEIFNTLQISEEQDKKRVLDVNRLVVRIDRAIEGQDLATAESLLKDLESIDPSSAILVMKRSKIEHLKNNTWEGYDQYKSNLAREIAQLQLEASQKERAMNLEEARQVWLNIIAKDPLDTEAVRRAQVEVDRLNLQIEQQRAEMAAQQERRSNRKLMMAMGSVIALVILAIALLYFVMRRRHAQMLRQVEQQAILPLQELREKGVLGLAGAGSGSGGPGLALATAGAANLIGQAEESDAEFMIPETEAKSKPDEGSGFDDPFADDFMASFEDDSVVGSVDSPATEEIEVVSSAAPKFEESDASVSFDSSSVASDDDDDFSFDFGEAEEERKKKEARVSTLPRSPSQKAEDTQSDVLNFDLGDEFSSEPTARQESTLTATELPSADAMDADAEEIVFSFGDSDSEEKASLDATGTEDDFSLDTLEPPKAPAASAKSPSPEDSVYETISLDDLSLDDSVSESLAGLDTDLSTAGANPLGGDLDLDLKLDMPADTEQTVDMASGIGAPMPDLDLDLDTLNEGTAPLPAAASGAPAAQGASGNGVLHRENYDALEIGSMPEGWSGSEAECAQLQVAGDPDGNGKCLCFRKEKGEGPSSFACRFPEVTGRVVVEFDIRCDEKNKHLLGFYIEKDTDFRRSVHTVVQCIDIERPAYLRIFTKPTPYTLKTWRHVKYVIDMPNGLVDGYVDDRLVAEGVRMGTKTDGLNTFSIRDNTESTGVLMLNNLIVYRAPEAD